MFSQLSSGPQALWPKCKPSAAWAAWLSWGNQGRKGDRTGGFGIVVRPCGVQVAVPGVLLMSETACKSQTPKLLQGEDKDCRFLP